MQLKTQICKKRKKRDDCRNGLKTADLLRKSWGDIGI